MEKYESLENNILGSQKILERKLKELKKIKDRVSFNSKKQEIESELEDFSELLDLFEVELTDATPKESEEYLPRFEQYQEYHAQIEKEVESIEFKMKKNEAKNQVYESETVNLNQTSKQKPLEQMDAQELDANIQNKMDEGIQDLDEIIKTLTQTRNLGREIIVETKRQQEKLDLIRDDINECYSLSKKSAKLLKYFKKQIMTDKIICVFIILICIAIIVIIGLRIAGYKTDTYNPSVIPNQSTQTETT